MLSRTFWLLAVLLWCLPLPVAALRPDSVIVNDPSGARRVLEIDASSTAFAVSALALNPCQRTMPSPSITTVVGVP